jgi:hypothetical protein
MKALQIRCYDEAFELIGSFQALHFDLFDSHGYAYLDHLDGVREFVPINIDHWSIEAGIITVYYKGGGYMEIARIFI